MAFLPMPKASRKMQKTLKNLRVSVLCFLLTFLVLRNTVGAGKFGTPAQDFEEIRQHLHYVRMHRKHYRVLAEAVEEEKKIEVPLLTLEERSGEGGRLANAPLHVIKEEQGSALIVKQGRALQGGVQRENVGVQKDVEGSRIERWDEEKKAKETSVQTGYGASRVLLLAGAQASACNSPAGDHFLLQSLKNKADYATLHGLEISVSFGGVDPETSRPLSKLSLLQRTMARNPHVEWLWWMPSGALIADTAYMLPIENYTQFNLVFLGVGDDSLRKKSSIDLNTDIFLIRNCQWSLDFLLACAHHADADQASRLLTSYLFKGPHGEASEQCALISHSNQRQNGFSDRIYTQHAAVLSGNWRDVVVEVEREVGTGGERLPFVTHFLGCDACQKAENEACATRIEKAISSAEKQSMRIYAAQRKSLA